MRGLAGLWQPLSCRLRLSVNLWVLVNLLTRHALASRQEAFIGYSEKQSTFAASPVASPDLTRLTIQPQSVSRQALSAGDEIVLSTAHGKVSPVVGDSQHQAKHLLAPLSDERVFCLFADTCVSA